MTLVNLVKRRAFLFALRKTRLSLIFIALNEGSCVTHVIDYQNLMQLFVTSSFLLYGGLAAGSGLFAEKLALDEILILITTSISNSGPQLV